MIPNRLFLFRHECERKLLDIVGDEVMFVMQDERFEQFNQFFHTFQIALGFASGVRFNGNGAMIPGWTSQLPFARALTCGCIASWRPESRQTAGAANIPSLPAHGNVCGARVKSAQLSVAYRTDWSPTSPS